MEIEQYQIKVKYIKGIKNTLADTISRLIIIDPNTCQDPGPMAKNMGIVYLRKYPMPPQLGKYPQRLM